jgi:cell division protein FtsQ
MIGMEKGKVVSIEDRVPKLKQQRRKKANQRLIFLLLLFFSLIACVSYFQSPLSKVNNIKIIGNELYSTEQIVKQSGITTEQNIWKINKKQIAASIRHLPELKEAKVKIVLPRTVLITVKEYERIAYLVKETSFYPVLENGNILNHQKLSSLPINAPILKDFSEGEVLEEMIISLKELPSEVVNSISEIHYTPTDTDTYHINLFMNDGFEISATLRSFTEKMLHYPSILSQLDPKVKGIIDLEVGSYFKAYETGGDELLEDEGER